ncbi:DUF3139 domain-containing protein [Bacillus alkalicellulosilyticus]|uniref:DUF3139 domain-containing protein n=1 Tax=Alkalihalobacterium alkalicellulosilyticum TaxID=1912214 RepID=UPI00099856A6|nr:DUF3139 domain-containing protein [Bacillus alkalicellulosilyticus]
MLQKKLLVVILSVLMVSIVVVPIGLLYVLNNGNPYTKYLAEKYVPTHLEEVGYSKEDIKQTHYIEPKHLINKDFYHGHYKVIFQDEPTVVYYYGVTKKGKEVIQFCEREPTLGIVEQITEQTKHSVLDCDYSLENRK